MGDHFSSEIERRVLLLPPTKRDGEFTLALLAKADLVGVVCPDLGNLCHEMPLGAAAIVITADALNADGRDHLAASLEQQPGWSDMPIILLLNTGQQAGLNDAIWSLGNVTLLERPAPARSVVSAIRTAVRARQRQYQIRDHIAEQKEAAAALDESRKRFEAMANSIPQLAWMAKPDGWIFWYNQRWHAYCGTTPEDMEGWGWKSVHSPAELPGQLHLNSRSEQDFE
jgi:PAS domain-containing protein